MENMQIKTDTIYCGDCLDVLRRFPEGFVNLIYLDPPFSSGRIYNIVFGTNSEKKAFDDRWKGGIHHYIEYMRERLELAIVFWTVKGRFIYIAIVMQVIISK